MNKTTKTAKNCSAKATAKNSAKNCSAKATAKNCSAKASEKDDCTSKHCTTKKTKNCK